MGDHRIPVQEWKEKYSIECERRRKLLIKKGSGQAVVPLLEFSGASSVLLQLLDVALSVPKKGYICRQQNTFLQDHFKFAETCSPGCTIWCRN